MTRRIALTLTGALLGAQAAWAGSVLEDVLNACSTINCAATTVRGVHQAREPFVIQLFAAEGECLRLDVTEQSQDLAMLISSPSVNLAGINDDRDFNNGDFRPLITIDPVPATGWYTVVVSHFDLVATVGKFTLKYGRYATGNANCPVQPTASAPTLELRSANPSKPLAAGSATGIVQ